MSNGRFIVLEGIDGAGTTTQCGLLAKRLRKEGVAVRTTREPSDGPVGTTIRQILAGRIVGAGGRAPGWATMALLFAADRMDHVEAEIEPFLAQGGVIISDRYDASSLAYQSVSSGRGGEATVEWIRTLNKNARRPDVTIVLDVSAEVAVTRREARGDAAQLYEQNELQRALCVFYKDLQRHIPNDRVVVVDGTGNVDATAEKVYAAYKTG
ncbi:MAG TPA: dTMP kinase [Polyangiaceae bacterium]|jgi:dTMP kinase|nr:dTMP kinase [Polyangiaceae bacterium]